MKKAAKRVLRSVKLSQNVSLNSKNRSETLEIPMAPHRTERQRLILGGNQGANPFAIGYGDLHVHLVEARFGQQAPEPVVGEIE